MPGVFAVPHRDVFFRLYGGYALSVFPSAHSRVARLSDRAWPAVAIAPVATSAQAPLERSWCCHGGIVAEVRHSARAVEMNSGDARKTAKIFLKPRVFGGVISVPDVHLDHRRRVTRFCDVAVFVIVAHAHN